MSNIYQINVKNKLFYGISYFFSLSVKPGPVLMNTELISWQEATKDTRNSFSTGLSLSLYLVFTEVRLEKPTSHIYVGKNGSTVKIALLASMGDSLAAAHQKNVQR